MRRTDSYERSFIGVKNPNMLRPEPQINKNVEWMREPFAWFFYPSVIAIFAFLLRGALSQSWAFSLTTTSVLHGMVTFSVFHWIKGSPDFYSQGVFNGLTLWEQIDDGEPWTNTKKFLMLVPSLLLLVALYASEFSPVHMGINVPIWAALIFAKLPVMQGVRILGINSTPGIDDDQKKLR